MPHERFAVIGLGRFGSRLAAKLAAAGRDVIAIDRDVNLVDDLRDRVTLAVALDATDEQALRANDIGHVDVAVVGIGDNFEAAVLATVVLKQLGVKRVISRAMTATAATILRKIGADDVVRPEDESADRWCGKLVSPEFLSQHVFSAGHSVVEIRTPGVWVGKTLAELNLRAQTRVLVVAVKRRELLPSGAEREVVAVLSPSQPLEADQILVLAGADEDLAQLPRDK